MKAFLDRNSTLTQWLSGLGIPIALVLASWLITNRIENIKLNSEYVRIALGILSKDKKSDTQPSTEEASQELALRQWAIRLLNLKSPERFTTTEQAAILNIPKPFGGYSSYDSSSTYSSYDRSPSNKPDVPATSTPIPR